MPLVRAIGVTVEVDEHWAWNNPTGMDDIKIQSATALRDASRVAIDEMLASLPVGHRLIVTNHFYKSHKTYQNVVSIRRIDLGCGIYLDACAQVVFDEEELKNTTNDHYHERDKDDSDLADSLRYAMSNATGGLLK